MTAVEAERLFRAGFYAQAQEVYHRLADGGAHGAPDEDRRREWRLRESVCLACSGRRETALAVAEALLPETEGTVWQPRTLRWIAQLHRRNGDDRKYRQALVAAHRLYPGLRAGNDTRCEEIYLNLELLAELTTRETVVVPPAEEGSPEELCRGVDPCTLYFPEWSAFQRICYLFRQIQWLAGTDPASACTPSS